MQSEGFPSGRDYGFALLVIVCLILITLSVRHPILNQSFQKYIVEVVTPVVQLLRQPLVISSDSIVGWSDHLGIVDENRELKEKVSYQQSLERKILVLDKENSELRNLLGMAQSFPSDLLGAKIKVDALSPFTRSVLVDVGVKQGVEKGHEVINKDGIVGRITEVFPHYARVLLLTDYTSRIPIKILESRVKGLVKGTNGRYLDLMLIEEDSNVQPNMLVVTSGAGGVFTEGLIVGVVRKLNNKLLVEPEVNFGTLDAVSVQRRDVYGILQLEEGE